MARSTWKRREREAARIVGGRRYPANQGGRLDVTTEGVSDAAPGYVVQVKEVGRLSLASIEALAEEVARLGAQKPVPHAGLVMLKRSAGRGRWTPWLIVMTEDVFRFLNGRLPTEHTP